MSLFSSSLNVHTNDVLNDEPADPVVACAQAAEGDLPSRRLCRPRPQWLRGEGEGVTAALKLEAASAVRMRPSGLRPEVRVRTVSDTDCSDTKRIQFGYELLPNILFGCVLRVAEGRRREAE